MYDRLLRVDQWRKKKLITSTNIECYTYIQWVSDSNGQMRINMGDNGIKGCETILIFVQKKVCSKKIIYF